MLELYQFRHSAFCLKVRMALLAKGISYKVIEVIPGVGQVDIFRLSGQRKVPLIIDKENIISDSSAIIHYLEKKIPEPRLIPDDLTERAQTHLIDDWANTTLAKAVRNNLIKAAMSDESLREALLPQEIPNTLKGLIKVIPCEMINEIGDVIGNNEDLTLLRSLEELSNLVEKKKWIIGDCLSIADISVAAQISLIKFPKSSGECLANKGSKSLANNPKLKRLFTWRDELDIYLNQLKTQS